MKLSDLTNHAGEWLRGSGPMSEIVISSRIRLARNLAGLSVPHPLHAASAAGARDTRPRDDPRCAARAADACTSISTARRRSIAQLLVERHLISKPHAAAEGARGVAIGENETLSIMVNEEDHLRIQVLRSGPAARRGLGADQRRSTTSSKPSSTSPSTRASATSPPAPPTSAPASASA